MPVRKSIRNVYLKFFALRHVDVVTLDEQHAAALGMRPGPAIKLVALALPSPKSLLIGFVSNTAIIGLFCASIVYKLSPGDYTAAVGPTLIFGLHSTTRMAWKMRERVAIEADWPVPIARQKPAFLAFAACLGLLVGAGTMFWFLLSLSTPMEKPTIMTASMITGAVEMIRNSIRIGGKSHFADFNIDDYTHYLSPED